MRTLLSRARMAQKECHVTAKEYSPEFKREAVELARQPGVSIRQVAEELGISAGNLARWKRELARVK